MKRSLALYALSMTTLKTCLSEVPFLSFNPDMVYFILSSFFLKELIDVMYCTRVLILILKVIMTYLFNSQYIFSALTQNCSQSSDKSTVDSV